MADGITLNSGTGGSVVATDDDGTAHHQYVKVEFGADNTQTKVTSSAGLPVTPDSGGFAVTVSGTVTVDGSGVTQPVSGTVTADAGTGPWPVTDNSGTLTIDNTNIDNLSSFDFDTGVGTDTTPAIGIAVAANGGAAAITGDATNGLDVDVTRVSGTVTVDASGTAVPVTDNAGSLTVDNGGTFAVQVDAALPAGTNAIGKLAANSGVDIGDVDVTSVDGVAAEGAALGNGILLQGDDGTDRKNINVDATTGDVQVDVTNTVTVDATSSGDVPVTLAGETVTLAAGTNTNEVVGDVAHDAAAAGNPVLVAGVAQDVDDTAPPNRVTTEADAARLATDFDGAVFVRPHGPQIWSYHLDTSTAQTDTTVHASPGAGLSLYVTDIVFSSGAATAINLFFEESTTKVLGPYYLEATAGRGMSVHFQTPKKITAATALTLTTSASIAHAVDVTGFVGQG